MWGITQKKKQPVDPDFLSYFKHISIVAGFMSSRVSCLWGGGGGQTETQLHRLLIDKTTLKSSSPALVVLHLK